MTARRHRVTWAPGLRDASPLGLQPLQLALLHQPLGLGCLPQPLLLFLPPPLQQLLVAPLLLLL